MSEDTKYKFKHKLNFLDLPSVGSFYISEPIKFDGSTHKVKQDGKRFGRDVVIADENIEFTFTRDLFERLNTWQQLLDGQPIEHASHGYDYLLDCFSNEGWESRIEYILEYSDGTQFVKGIFDYFTCKVLNDALSFKIIQDTKRELVKRKDDVYINAFNDKDLDGNSITPCSTTNILLKAKPIVQTSEWEQIEPKVYSFIPIGINPARSLKRYGIDDSYTPFDDVIRSPNNGSDAIRNFAYINAKYQLFNGSYSFKAKLNFIFDNNGETVTGSVRLLLVKYAYPFVNGQPVDITVAYTKNFYNSGTFYIDETITGNLPSLNQGEGLSIYWQYSFVATGVISLKTTFDKFDMQLKYASTSFDSVIKGVRLIDLIKHNVKSISQLDTLAPYFDVGGKYYDLFTFNGYLIGQVADKPFNNKFKDLMELLGIFCYDYQINPDKVEILPYKEFYNDVEMASFTELPSSESSSIFDKNYFINTIDIGFKNSSKGRETNEDNTINDVHGKAQFTTKSKTADGNLKREFDVVLSAFLIEEQRRRVVDASQSKSLQYDDNLFLLDCKTIAPSTTRSYTAKLRQQRTGSALKLLSTNFSWNLLGFNTSGLFRITAGNNIGVYNIIEITPSVLLLGGGTLVPFTGESIITIEYFLNNVQYENVTNEYFSSISGVAEPNDYANLRLSIGRIMQNWYPYLATATKYIPNTTIDNTYFEPNGNLVTRLISESTDLADSGSIDVNSISTLKILNPILHEVEVFADFNQILQLMYDVQNVKGYVSTKLNDGRMIKGFISELVYEWATAKLTLTLQEKFESDFMTINDKVIKEVGYDEKLGLSNFEVNDIFVILYNKKDVSLCKPTRFNKILIDGVQYTDLIEFTEVLTNLINS